MSQFTLTDIWILPQNFINLMLQSNNLAMSGNSTLDRYTLTDYLSLNNMMVDPDNIISSPKFKSLYLANDNQLYLYAQNSFPRYSLSASTSRFDFIKSIILMTPPTSTILELEDIWVLPESSIKAMLEANGLSYSGDYLLDHYNATELFSQTTTLSQYAKNLFSDYRFRELYLTPDDQLIAEIVSHPDLIQPNALSTHFTLLKTLLDLPLNKSSYKSSSTSSDESLFEPEPYPEDQVLTDWKLVGSSELDKDEKTCSVCMCSLLKDLEDSDYNDDVVVRLGKCVGHHFHRDCIRQCKQGTSDQAFIKCPLCSTIYGVRRGNQPDGEMKIYTIEQPCPGFPGCNKMIKISFDIPKGIQGPDHQNPGIAYSSDHRVAYLPDTPEGREVLRKFKIAWERKLLFTIGNSITTGQSNVVTYAGIHMKTNVHGAHGYPDDTYLMRVTQELADKGVV